MADPLWTSQAIVAATGGRLDGEAFDCSGVSIDTRSLEAGDLFVALAGVRDGHTFIPEALKRGAGGVLASQTGEGARVVVGDTLRALEQLGEAARVRATQTRRGAVTGSVGKTSVTQAIRAGLDRAGPAHGSVKSYNNHIGVPLTLARMPRATQRAIFEIGMNHADEIAPLTRMVRPHAVVITTVAPVHIEAFPDGEAGVARAKAEIFEGLEPGGVAVLNADNPWFDFLAGEAKAHGAQVLAFGTGAACEARLTGFELAGQGARATAVLHGRPIEIGLRQTGAHWGLMGLAAVLMMEALDVSLDDGLAALAAFDPLEGRGAERRVALAAGAFTLVDDSYNANPLSVAAALRTLGLRSVEGRRIVALTDMLELGPGGADYHAALAPEVEAANIDLVFSAGPLMESLWRALPPTRQGGYAKTAAELIPLLTRAVEPGDVVVVKGSKASNATALADALARLDSGSGGYGLMLYLLYERLAEHHHYVPVLNLLHYLTFRSILALATAQLTVVAMGSRFIRWMQAKQGKGQPIRAEGIERHIVEKAGTPTMGGLMFLAGIAVGTLLWGDLANVYVWVVLLVTFAFGLLGFMDDYAKVTKQTTAGISGKFRLAVEAGVGVLAVFLMMRFGDPSPEGVSLSTSVAFPFFKSALLNIGLFYLPFGAVVIIGASNAVNFTDGLDGLATVPVMIAAGTFGLIAYLVGNFVFARYLQLHFVPGVGEVGVFCAAMVGSCLGFLWYNAPPAKIFMGDFGALALGGALGAVAVATKHEIVLAIVGGLFVLETVSVMVQVASFKLTGRRVFRMAPIHHHFERLGWAEPTIVIRFWIIAVMLALVGLSTLKLR